VAGQLSDQISRRMKLHDLHVFMAVMQTGSMGKAARQLNVSQPAISRSIAELEHTLGVSLFDRYRYGIEPTQYGRALLESSVAVFDDLHQGVKRIEFLADPAAGEVRVGYNPFLAAKFVSVVIDRLSRRYPRIIFYVVPADAETLRRDLREREIDLYLTWRSGPFTDKQLAIETLYEESFAVAAGATNPWVSRRKIELGDLIDENWTLPPPDTVIGSIAMDAFRAKRLNYPRATVVTVSPDIRILLLATGRYLSIFPISGLRFIARRPDIKALPVELPMAGASIGVVTLRGRVLSPAARLFIENAREVAKVLVRSR